MSPQTFLIASVVTGVLTVLVLLWALDMVKLRSSRLVALKVAAGTVFGGVVLWLAGRVIVGVLEG
ncbi:hypothetical protein [uncultured Nocardioides sp.]|uniref:hypothetical protein n=1 Tax=uncultured Nocardioides sp. TaxID=198441 RepID=UPI0026313743|nr:hypothetical protein [uncultured Nocardioides sp.]